MGGYDQLTPDNWQDYNLDTRITSLVVALAHMPGIITKSSCGGHFDPNGHGQRKYPNWYVTFAVTREALVTLTSVLDDLLTTGGLKLKVEWRGRGVGIAWLECDDSIYEPIKVDPNQVAACLLEYLQAARPRH